MEESIDIYVVDASYVLSFLMPDERTAEVAKLFDLYQKRGLNLIAPELIFYEIANSLWTNVTRKRISAKNATELIITFNSLQIPALSVDFQQVLQVSLKHNISCYDSSYVVLAREKKAKLLTFDKRLQRIV